MPNQPADKKVVLVLFHNDLRLHDNATLHHAAVLSGLRDNQSDNRHLILLYAPRLADDLNREYQGAAYTFAEKGAARQQFITESLADLDKSLQRLGNRLLYITATEKLGVAEQVCQLIAEQGVTDICVSQTADYLQNVAYTSLQAKYPQINWHYQTTATLFAAMPTKDLPASFTQFRKQVEYGHNLLTAAAEVDIWQTPMTLAPLTPSLMDNTPYFFEISVSNALSHTQRQGESNFKGGETQALAHLTAYFDSKAPSRYKATRNALDEWTHSTKFSPWLANGSLSVKTLLHRLRDYEREIIANESTYWIWFELLWREYFYWYAVTHQHQLFLFEGIRAHKPPTRYHKQRLQQWKNGETAYPIINACMQQLNRTGYMSNRGRQLVASCFIHELGLDWRYGASYFEQQLLDYDVASNWGNWQYLAGVGADPRGCRQFNLKKQTQQYDPNGEFQDKWLS